VTSILYLVQNDNQDQMHQFKLKLDRFYFTKTQGWYFHCRDGQRGPFETKSTAEQALVDYINEQNI